MQSVLLTTGETAQLLGFTPEYVRRLEKAGKLSAQRTARGVRLFSRHELEKFRASRRSGDPRKA